MEVISGRAQAVIAVVSKLLKDPLLLERLLTQDYERMAKAVKASGAKAESGCRASQASICAGSLTVLSCW